MAPRTIEKHNPNLDIQWNPWTKPFSLRFLNISFSWQAPEAFFQQQFDDFPSLPRDNWIKI